MKFNNNNKGVIGFKQTWIFIVTLMGAMIFLIGVLQAQNISNFSPVQETLILKTYIDLREDEIRFFVLDQIGKFQKNNIEKYLNGDKELSNYEIELKTHLRNVLNREFNHFNSETFEINFGVHQEDVTIVKDIKVDDILYIEEFKQQIQRFQKLEEEIEILKSQTSHCNEESFNRDECLKFILSKDSIIKSMCSAHSSKSEINCIYPQVPFLSTSFFIQSTSRGDSVVIEDIKQDDIISATRENKFRIDLTKLNLPSIIDGFSGYFIFYSELSTDELSQKIKLFEEEILSSEEDKLLAITYDSILNRIDGEKIVEEISSNIKVFDIDLDGVPDFHLRIETNTLIQEIEIENTFNSLFIVDNKIIKDNLLTQRSSNLYSLHSNSNNDNLDPNLEGPQ